MASMFARLSQQQHHHLMRAGYSAQAPLTSQTTVADVYLRDWVDVHYPRHRTPFASLRDLFERLSAFHVVAPLTEERLAAASKKRKRERDEQVEKLKRQCRDVLREASEFEARRARVVVEPEQWLVLEAGLFSAQMRAPTQQRQRWARERAASLSRERRAAEKRERERARAEREQAKAEDRVARARAGEKSSAPQAPLRQSARARTPAQRR